MPRQSKGPRLIKRKNKPNWFIRYIDENSGKQRDVSTGHEVRAEAEEALEEFLRERRTNRIGLAVRHNQFTIAQALSDYTRFKIEERAANQDSPKPTKNPNDRLFYSIQNVLKFWGDLTIDHINIETVQRYTLSRKKEGKKQSTARRDLTDLRAAIYHSVNMNRIVPFNFPDLPKDGPPKKRWMTDTEFAQLLFAAGNNQISKFNLRLFMIIGFYSGARKSAIMELEWDQIDFEQGTIDFNKRGAPTSKKKRAFIYMPPEIQRFLQRRYDRYAHQTTYLFHEKKNPKIRVNSIDKAYRKAVKLSGLSNVTPHTLRHSRISLMLQRGETIMNVSNYVHVSPATIQKVYGHHSNEELKKVSQRLGREKKHIIRSHETLNIQ